MREERIIARVKSIVEKFQFDRPFSVYLNRFFRLHPEMGSADRRVTKELCYTFFRIGRIQENWNFEDRLSLACFLCGNTNSELQKYLKERLDSLKNLDFNESLEVRIKQVGQIYPSFNLKDVFPLNEFVSPGIKKDQWYFSFFQKPKVWIRIRKSKVIAVIRELTEKDISFATHRDEETLAFEPGTKLENTESWKKGYFEIQDLNSQHTLESILPEAGEYWWDACAGSGGKSLLLQEIEPRIRILATDSRESILKNYKLRMQKAGNKNFEVKLANLEKENIFEQDLFDGIIADVPCSGSGTWSRSPEWLCSFSAQTLFNHFIPLQKKIIHTIYPSLKKGKSLIYITCSVFKNENEENVRYFSENLPLKLDFSTYLEGCHLFADTLFVARFTRI